MSWGTIVPVLRQDKLKQKTNKRKCKEIQYKPSRKNSNFPVNQYFKHVFPLHMHMDE